MKISLIGTGCGNRDAVTGLGRQRIEEADLLIGAERMLAPWREIGAECVKSYIPSDILGILKSSNAERACLLFSGDTGFYSGASSIAPLLIAEGMEFEVIPGISSLQRFSSQLLRTESPKLASWQNWLLCSAHGEACSPVSSVMQGKPVFFLTSGGEGPAGLCKALTDAGLGFLKTYVGENLGYENEQLIVGTAEAFSTRSFAPLNCLLCEPAPTYPMRTPGICDDDFIRDKVPMTKSEVRSAVLGKLAVRPEDVCWDIGAGTGSVSIELAQHCRAVWAVEQKPEALELAGKNREKFMAWNLTLREGKAPDGLSSFPAPDAVFIGGSGGNLPEIIDAVLAANPKARVCVSAIALETLSLAVSAMQERGMNPEICQISTARAKAAGNLHLLMAQNPIFLITGEAT